MKIQSVARFAVETVAGDRRTNMRQVYAELMRTTSVRMEFDKRVILGTSEYRVGRLGRFTFGVGSKGTGSRGMPANRNVNRGVRGFGYSIGHGYIVLVGFAFSKLRLESVERFGCTCSDHHSTSIAVEPMHNAGAIGAEPYSGVTAKKLCYGKLVVERALAMRQNSGRFVDYDNVVIQI